MIFHLPEMTKQVLSCLDHNMNELGDWIIVFYRRLGFTAVREYLIGAFANPAPGKARSRTELRAMQSAFKKVQWAEIEHRMFYWNAKWEEKLESNPELKRLFDMAVSNVSDTARIDRSNALFGREPNSVFVDHEKEFAALTEKDPILANQVREFAPSLISLIAPDKKTC